MGANQRLAPHHRGGANRWVFTRELLSNLPWSTLFAARVNTGDSPLLPAAGTVTVGSPTRECSRRGGQCSGWSRAGTVYYARQTGTLKQGGWARPREPAPACRSNRGGSYCSGVAPALTARAGGSGITEYVVRRPRSAVRLHVAVLVAKARTSNSDICHLLRLLPVKSTSEMYQRDFDAFHWYIPRAAPRSVRPGPRVSRLASMLPSWNLCSATDQRRSVPSPTPRTASCTRRLTTKSTP